MEKKIIYYFIIILISVSLGSIFLVDFDNIKKVKTEDILPELFGFLLDIIIMGIGFTIFQKIIEKQNIIRDKLDKIQQYKISKEFHSKTYLRETIGNLNKLGYSKFDFTGFDLSYIDLSDIDLSKSDFSGANLKGVNFYHSDLSGANFCKAKIDEHTQLKYAIYKDVIIYDMQLHDLHEANLMIQYFKTIKSQAHENQSVSV